MKRARHPRCIVIAGPNGAGKTTFAREYLPRDADVVHFVNADLIAGGLAPLRPASAALAAGRLFLSELDRLARARVDFAFETTLSGLAYVRWIKAARKQDYEVRLYYLWIPSVRLALKRIKERVRRGGHDIPAGVARRRYGKGLANLFRHYMPLADYVAIFDNSSALPTLVFERRGANGEIIRPAVFEVIRKQAGGNP